MEKMIKISDIKSNPNNPTCQTCGCSTAHKKNKGRKFCSRECFYNREISDGERLNYSNASKGRANKNKGIRKVFKLCKYCHADIIPTASVSIKNRVYCSKKCQSMARKGVPLSDEWKKKLSIARKESDKCKGENLYNWKGGTSTRSERNLLYFYKRKSQQKISLDDNFLRRLLLAQECRCFYCESDISGYKAIEHLTPLSRGGDNQPYNIVYSCRSCNSKKNTNTLEEFAIKNKKFEWIDKFDLIFPKAYYGI